MPGGATEQLHLRREAAQFFYVLRGIATVYVNEAETQLHPWQGIGITPGQPHRIANEHSGELEFLAISNPPTREDRINVRGSRYMWRPAAISGHLTGQFQNRLGLYINIQSSTMRCLFIKIASGPETYRI
ncbi:cupin domain-containing protein [Pedobacter sp. SYP-B3415]|uniref:cupin domain-containing protein n=1 Tax=Pedobacter sp. SYP-B3415 TaxID=2496641 RepID=UPI0013EE22D8|nr:cupin domain-containing protein [Pedobacter sp. SYP-B3415]